MLPTTLPATLERAARRFPDRGISIYEGRRGHSTRRTYPEILAAARETAGRWAALGVEPGDRVLVALPNSWDWTDAWLGVMLRGALPVAIAPGAAVGAAEAQMRKVDGLIERLEARFAVVPESFPPAAEKLAPELPHLRRAALTSKQLAGTAPASFTAPEPTPDDLAFLQLTSGSTGLPRAVMITHRGGVHNALACAESIGAPHGPVYEWTNALAAWLPLHHDMGLVGCFWQAILGGMDLMLLQPTAFLAKPKLWLDRFAEREKVFGIGPNFGFQLCLERLKESDVEGLDLSGWHDALTGAEMIRRETVDGFCERFAPCGFRPEVFRPCYGLAEATLAVTVDVQRRGLRTLPVPESALAGGAAEGFALSEVACVGETVLDTTVRIVDAAGHSLKDGEVGEVYVGGPCVFKGYYNDPESTAEGLKNGELATGDLGFMHEGELYLTGRTKDVLILHGHNVMPHEIEWVAEGVTGGGGAIRTGAFSVARGAQGEEPVLVVEVTDKDPEKLAAIGREIRSQLGRTLSLPLADLVFVRRGKIPKTTSGKVQRRALRAMYLDGSLPRL